MAEAQEQQPQEHGNRGSNRIQVSLNKRPMFFYVNLSKRLLGEHEEVHLSALGMAVSTMVSVAEILKKDGLAVETRVSTCMDSLGGEGGRRPVQKAKMEVLLKKSDNFDELIAAEKERQAAEGAAKHREEADEEGAGEAEEEAGEEGEDAEE